MSIYPVIMCGGSGVRLWPESRPDRPKQFLPLIASRSLFQRTAERMAPLAEGGGALVVITGIAHAAAVRDFNAVFWDGGAGQYHDWIDTAGKARSYFYVDIAFVAIIAGVANQSQSAALLRHYDTRLADIYADYKAACRAGLSPRDGV